jgi:riboflavin kinase/FMN adenylyltransferase
MKRCNRPVVLAAGFFDGLHLGHRRVLSRAVSDARTIGGEAWVLTLDPHPLAVVRPDLAPPLLTGTEHRLGLIAGLKLDGCLLLSFTATRAATEPERFVESLCRSIPSLTRILVGRNWRFGKGGRGDVELLGKLADNHGVTVRTVPSVLRGGRPVSSTRIRKAVANGRLDDAATLLGRPFSVLGTVTHGHAVGRTLGFPTANLKPGDEILPPYGVYAAWARCAHGTYPAVLNYGGAPTFAHRGTAPIMELHLLPRKGRKRVAINLYGKTVEVSFIAKLRSERRFKNADTLRRQIASDVEKVPALLARKKLKESLYTFI